MKKLALVLVALMTLALTGCKTETSTVTVYVEDSMELPVAQRAVFYATWFTIPRIVARQLRHSILRYMASDAFRPTLNLEPDVLRHLFERDAPAVNMFTNDSPDELKPKIK